MTSTPFDVVPGDAISRLVQLQAARVGVRLKWNGEANYDIALLCVEASNAHLVAKYLWDGMKELKEMKEFDELPDALQAKIATIILKSHALNEKAREERNTRAKRQAQAATPQPEKPA